MQRWAFVRLNRVTNVVVRRLGLRRFRGGPVLYLTTIGRKTGQSRTTPLLHLREGDGWVVVASNGGADWEPGWWLNLRAGTAATVQVDGVDVPVRGTEISGPEREQMWKRLVDEVFDFDTYQRKVRRRIAVVRLEPVHEVARP